MPQSTKALQRSPFAPSRLSEMPTLSVAIKQKFLLKSPYGLKKHSLQ